MVSTKLRWWIALAALLLVGHSSNSCSADLVAAQPDDESRAARLERTERALAKARAFLQKRQSPDGAWRSEAYAPFRDGDALTGLVLTAFVELPQTGDSRAVIDKGARYLAAMVDKQGRICPPNERLAYPLYTTSGAIMALSRPDYSASSAQRDAWLVYLRERQLAEPLDWQREDLLYGGWGYSSEPPRRPTSGQPLAPLAESNLSATVFALAALRAAGAPADDPAVQKGLVFVRRCQNFSADKGSAEKFDDGGFFFIQGDALRNKAGVSGTDAAGRQRYASYGSTTADGLSAMLMFPTPQDQPRIAAAWDWFAKHGAVGKHPGSYAKAREVARAAVYYYYCRSFSEALTLDQRDGPSCGPENSRQGTDWAGALADELCSRQRSDGSWVNIAVDQREDDPLVATSFAVGALANCLRLLDAPSSERCEAPLRQGRSAAEAFLTQTTPNAAGEVRARPTTLRGRFLYDGTPPEPKNLRIPLTRPMRTRDGEEWRLAAQAGVPDETLLVDKEGGVANVVIWVRSKIGAPPFDGPLPPATVRAKSYRLQPHVLAFWNAAALRFENDGPNALHVRWASEVNAGVNLLLKPGDPRFAAQRPSSSGGAARASGAIACPSLAKMNSRAAKLEFVVGLSCTICFR
jgi:squalene-hopene/tetraprenyl-beta-curcumene cyclase